ncbi:hypothetical protein SDC9_178723 [bioreactor metagenome]|uniref:Uncharacterized protein n=1 Tax=bioreactor metagenome TaxID=1076179 RepID=A0A645GZT7_9ZZZZ
MVMRSPISAISDSLCEMNTMPLPCAFNWRMIVNSRCTSSSVSDEVGSSITMTRALNAMAFAISTICFSLMLKVPTSVFGCRWLRFTRCNRSAVSAFMRAVSTNVSGPAFFVCKWPIKIFSRIFSQLTTLSSG